MKTVKVTFSNNDTITTGINGTDEEIRDYYAIGREFNLGNGEHDLMAKVVKVEFYKQYEAIFTGRAWGAIGSSEKIVDIVWGVDENDAILDLYERWEHIQNPKLKLINN